MQIIRLLETGGKCGYCGKEKEVVEVQMNGRKTCLCFVDLKRHIKLLAPEEKKA